MRIGPFVLAALVAASLLGFAPPMAPTTYTLVGTSWKLPSPSSTLHAKVKVKGFAAIDWDASLGDFTLDFTDGDSFELTLDDGKELRGTYMLEGKRAKLSLDSSSKLKIMQRYEHDLNVQILPQSGYGGVDVDLDEIAKYKFVFELKPNVANGTVVGKVRWHGRMKGEASDGDDSADGVVVGTIKDVTVQKDLDEVVKLPTSGA